MESSFIEEVFAVFFFYVTPDVLGKVRAYPQVLVAPGFEDEVAVKGVVRLASGYIPLFYHALDDELLTFARQFRVLVGRVLAGRFW